MPEELTITDIAGRKVIRPAKKKTRLLGVGYMGGNPVSPTITGVNEKNRTPSAYETRADYSPKVENEMFGIYEKLAYHNDFGCVFREALVSQICPHFHFESESGKHEDVEAFWKQHEMDTHLHSIVDQAVSYGTGVGQYTFIGKDARQLLYMTRLDTTSLELEKDKKGVITVKQTQKDEKGQETKVVIDKIPVGRPPEMIFFWQPFHNPKSAWGWSSFRPVIHNITGLSEMGRDIFAAIKNLAYNQRIMALDLSDANSIAEKDAAIADATLFFDRFESATNSVLVFENCHEYGFAGTAGGQTSAGARMQPLMPIIEPVLSVALQRFKIALGHFEQSDASRQILKEQEEAMERAIEPLRENLKWKILNEIVPRILGLAFPDSETDWHVIPEHDIRLVWDIGMPSNIRDKIDIYSLAIEYGMVTPQYAAQMCGFADPNAEWDEYGFLLKSEAEQDLEAAQIKAATMRPTQGKGGSVASRQDARRNVRNATKGSRNE